MPLVEAYAGEIRLFAGAYAPRGWALCDGRLLPIEQYNVLYALLGTTYGGDGRTTFALPDLRGRLPIQPAAAGDRPGTVYDGEAVARGADAHLATALALNYIICLRGVYPDRA